jgi:chromosome segregation ATPase
MEQQTVGLQSQSEQVVSSIESLQAYAGSLQQVIQTDGTTFQTEMDKMTNAEAQMRGQIEALNTQLASAYSQITQQQALAAAAAEAAAIQNSGGGGGHDDDHRSSGGGGHDDDHDDHGDDHGEHEDDD